MEHWNIDIAAARGYSVYILWENTEVAYVGFSSNVVSRLGQHFNNHNSYRKWNTNIVTSIDVIKLDSAREALDLESQLILELKPKYNSINGPIKGSGIRKPARSKSATPRGSLVGLTEEAIAKYLEGFTISDIAKLLKVHETTARRLVKSVVTMEQETVHRRAAISRLSKAINVCTDPAEVHTLKKKRGWYLREALAEQVS